MQNKLRFFRKFVSLCVDFYEKVLYSNNRFTKLYYKKVTKGLQKRDDFY